jgi:hypothetical protein
MATNKTDQILSLTFYSFGVVGGADFVGRVVRVGCCCCCCCVVAVGTIGSISRRRHHWLANIVDVLKFQRAPTKAKSARN